MDKTGYTIVGHRGFPQQYPENSLSGLVAAAQAGAPAVELDLQLSKDGVPMVFHDETLTRVTGESGYIWDYDAATLATISCHESTRFGEAFAEEKMASLEQVCNALAAFDVDIFIELKEASIERIDNTGFLEKVLQAAKAVLPRIHIISFDYDILVLAKQQRLSVGWVLNTMDAHSHEKAQNLAPNILIYDVKQLSLSDTLWPGNWQWFLYDIVDPEDAKQWHANGVQYIESWDVKALLP